ncbi:hypothetical protein J3E64_000583 [Sphingobium sp. OAS761]|uniref:sulfotransferase domain-containing protein n=1 Tax=Sphingobium sp. OAS761 TaxID=2817901 RepID=UPI0020A127C0|nr:sulfotransferase domain-containing protein [Sphingobium sp. OAS761]MCP1468912.1 hypothetical protein [Sphingobium sp. OAS761]
MSAHFISYPKSGRSWVRYALDQLGAAQDITFQHDGFEFNNGARPPLSFNVARRIERYREVDHVVYLERDPRDVMCSLFHQVTGRFQDFFGYRGSISDFLRDPYFGAENLKRFRAMWAEVATRRSVHRLSYEQMTRDSAGTLRGLADYLGLVVDDAMLERAVDAASFANMQAVEREGSYQQPWLRLRNGHPKVRQGRVHGYKAELDAGDIAYLNALFELD